jgi:hypothetical protein
MIMTMRVGMGVTGAVIMLVGMGMTGRAIVLVGVGIGMTGPVVMMVGVRMIGPGIVRVVGLVIMMAGGGGAVLVPHRYRMTRKSHCSTSTSAICAQLRTVRDDHGT